MVPPRTTKKSSLTTVTQTASRQGAQLSRKQIVEEVEELEDSDHAKRQKLHGEAELNERDAEQSHGTLSDPLGQLVANMVDSVRTDFHLSTKC